ncbi:phosphotransferase [Streptomyces hirsutus]|uniref:phosphotransferase n=1 Tax=Streptomyces hirsutus TaxID=35620 RepID=UPI0036593DE9
MLWRRFPGLVPKVVGVDDRRGWMLTEDFGTSPHAADPAGAVDAYVHMMPRFARLQRGLAGQTDRLLSASCPDHRLEVLPDLYGALVDHTDALTNAERRRLTALSGRFRALCARLRESGVPQTIVHQDLWRGNHTATAAGPLIYDWAESVVGHPFLSLDVVLRDVRSIAPGDVSAERRVTDAYLREWGDLRDAVSHRDAVPLASAPGVVSRALLCADALTSLPSSLAGLYAGTVAAQLRELLVPHRL